MQLVLCSFGKETKPKNKNNKIGERANERTNENTKKKKRNKKATTKMPTICRCRVAKETKTEKIPY